MVTIELSEKSEKNKYILSIVIVSWNVADLLSKCLQSIYINLSDIPFQVFVIDNASIDHTKQMLIDQFPWVNFISNKENRGFARANNQALSRIKGQYVLFLNPDTILIDDSLQRMIDFLENHPKVGMMGPRLAYPDGQVQVTCARLLPTLAWVLMCEALRLVKLPLVGQWISKKYLSPYNYDISQEVEGISGATMLVRRHVINEIGGFGDSFIHCGEDVDFCFRLRKAGWQIYYLSDAVVIHHMGQSSSQAPVRTSVNSVLSIQEYFYRCCGVRQGFLYKLIVKSVQIPAMVFYGFLQLVLGMISMDDYKIRLGIAKRIWLWKAL